MKKIIFVASAVAVALVLLMGVASAQAQDGYELLPFGLGEFDDYYGTAPDAYCDWDSVSARCWGQFGANTTYFNGAWARDHFGQDVSGEIVGAVYDVFYKTSAASVNWQLFFSGSNLAVPGSLDGRHVTVCMWDAAEAFVTAPVAGVDCDHVFENSAWLNPAAPVVLGGIGANDGMMEAVFWNFAYIVPVEITPTPMPTPIPPVTSTTHTVQLPSGAVATVPMTATAGEIIVTGAVGFLITLQLWEISRSLVHMVSKR